MKYTLPLLVLALAGTAHAALTVTNGPNLNVVDGGNIDLTGLTDGNHVCWAGDTTGTPTATCAAAGSGTSNDAGATAGCSASLSGDTTLSVPWSTEANVKVTFQECAATSNADVGSSVTVTITEACDASTAPTNGAVGDCTSTLASGSTCQPTCNTGYTVSGTSSCTTGTLTAATCAANSCDASTAPTNGAVGDCTNTLASGSTCQPTCNTGYTVSGTSSCTAGTLTAATCDAAPTTTTAGPGAVTTAAAADVSRALSSVAFSSALFLISFVAAAFVY